MDVLWLNQALMFMTPQHEVKELRDEAGRNIAGGTMLCPELVDVGEVYRKRTKRKGDEGVKQRGRGRGKEREMKGKRRKLRRREMREREEEKEEEERWRGEGKAGRRGRKEEEEEREKCCSP